VVGCRLPAPATPTLKHWWINVAIQTQEWLCTALLANGWSCQPGCSEG